MFALDHRENRDDARLRDAPREDTARHSASCDELMNVIKICEDAR